MPLRCSVPVLKTRINWAEHGELAALFFFQAMATAMWIVPLSRVLNAHELSAIQPYAFAATGLAAFISPLIFGAMADRHASPLRVLRGLSVASAISMALASWSIEYHWPGGMVLVLIQIYAICAVPTNSIASAIVFSRLHNSQKQFGPVRATATIGWMCGCWLISAMNSDSSPAAGYAGALVWVVLAVFTFLLPTIDPIPQTGRISLRERMGWDALALLKNLDHRVVFITVALFSIPLAAFYPFTPQQLQQLGFHRTTAWMSLGQVTEIIAMFGLARLLARWRLKWIFVAGLAVGLLRFGLCALNDRKWLLIGLTLHGFSFTLFFITAQIYLNERVDHAWRARAQALMWLMNGGVGNLVGYLGTGLWFKACSRGEAIRWGMFWGGLALVIGLVLIYFLVAYRGRKRITADEIERRDVVQTPI
jgi:MFS family permease